MNNNTPMYNVDHEVKRFIETYSRGFSNVIQGYVLTMEATFRLEEVPALNEIQVSLIKQLWRFDHTYSYSDDGDVYRNRLAQHQKLAEEIKANFNPDDASSLTSSIESFDSVKKVVSRIAPATFLDMNKPNLNNPRREPLDKLIRGTAPELFQLLSHGYVAQMEQVIRAVGDLFDHIKSEYAYGHLAVAGSNYNYTEYLRLRKLNRLTNEGNVNHDWREGVNLPSFEKAVLDIFLSAQQDRIESLSGSAFNAVYEVFGGSLPISVFERCGLKIMRLNLGRQYMTVLI